MTTSVGNNLVYRSFFEKQKLTGPNFIDWYTQLRLVLSTEDKENYLEHHIPAAPVAQPGQQVPPEAHAAHASWVKGQKEVDVLMLLTMDLEIQQNLAHLSAYDMLQELKALYSKQAEQELVQTVREFHTCKQEEGQSVSSHVLKMKGYIDNLERLGQPFGRSYLKGLAIQGLRGSKKLKPGALILYVGHGHRAAFEAIGTYHLELPSRLVIVFNNFHHDFLDRPKEYGIIAHRTHPYTPQNNGVSERRNQTLLDMVRSMMSQTTLPKSFWDYALETATSILNMVPTKKVEKTPYEFFESKLLDQKASGSVEDLKLIQKEDTNPSVDTSLNHEEDYQEIDEPQSDINPICRSTRTRHLTYQLCLYIDAKEHKLGDLGEPANYKATLLDPKSKKWLDAMNVEMQSIKDNDVWVLVELPPNARTVGSKWLFKKKTDMDGAVYIFKAHLVVKGFTQNYRVNYKETFSHVADIRAIRILIAIATYYDYEIWQMDVKTAFLNGHLSEEVYMEQPKGFVNLKYPNHVCKLKRSIMDLSKYQGDAAYILGIKIYYDRSKRLIGLCQSAYIEKILKRYYMENSKRGTIPMQEKLKLRSIMYAVRCTRPDVAFVQNMTSRFQQNASEEHWTAVKNILKYLRNTKDMFLTGYVFVLNGGVVDWKSTKQSIFSTSSTDAEYITTFDASKDVVWIRKFIYGLGIVPIIKEPISMYCDNTRAITIAKDDGFTKGARHFCIKVYYLRETIKLGDVK
uniref:Putative retrotransposon protein n=1 Tax=Tanacetum cinerariifolium TaxID=118510 RepID=A0A6L2P253_TANCI|nr:putative retrotransposon protein [Tanacetum cinerariifolium]